MGVRGGKGAAARGMVKKSLAVTFIEGKEIGGNDTIEYIFPARVESIS